jgi:hypothetical protein
MYLIKIIFMEEVLMMAGGEGEDAEDSVVEEERLISLFKSYKKVEI